MERLMRRILVVFVLLAMAVAVAGAQEKANASPRAGGDVAQTITSLENQWAKDSTAGNAAGVGALLADDFVNLDSDGTSYGKTETLERVKKAKWETNAVSDIKVTTHGNTAIATGVWKGKGTSGSGKAVDSDERWVDTWVKMANGKWLCVATASATMK
jgi:ketosteroid isomerase-like protein